MTDDQIQQRVEDALDWADPSVDGSRIGVTVDGGVVTLRGSVDTRSQKATAERVAMLVRGVNAVVNGLAVRPVAGLEPTDTDIAQTAVQGIERGGRRAAERDGR
jgi:hypothetical protein